MTPMQEQLAQGFAAFMTVLDNLPGGTPDLHIGVISSDMGAGIGINAATTSETTAAFSLTPRASDQCPTPADNFIALRTDPATGARTTNYTATLPEVFGCIAMLGTTGCGFEQPLLSVMRALGADGFDPPAENQGFLRPEAFLGVVLVTNEDDCSAVDGANSALFSTNPNTLSGHVRSGDELPLQRVRPPLPRRRATAPSLAHASGQLRELSIGGRRKPTGSESSPRSRTSSAALRRLKGDPAKVFVASIAGPPSPYQVALQHAPIPDTGDWPSITASCGVNADGSVFADPAVRLAHMTRLLGPYGLFESICGDGSNMPLENIARRMTAPIDSPCVPLPSAGQSCRVVDRWIDPDGTKHAADVTSCLDDPAAVPCWRLVGRRRMPRAGPPSGRPWRHLGRARFDDRDRLRRPGHLETRWFPRFSPDVRNCRGRAILGTPMRPRIDPFEKRRKELARKQRQKEKAERRDIRDRDRAQRPAGETEEDPDIAGIVPGPQPPAEVE